MGFFDAIDWRGMCLGKHPVRHDPRTLKLADYITDLPSPPPARDWTAKLGEDLGMLGNDRLGDCTCATAAHMIQVWTSQIGMITMPSEREVIEAYMAVGGYDGVDPATDQGANMLDVLNYWRKTGIGGHKIGAYVKVDHNPDSIQLAIDLFGGVYTGANLPRSAQNGAWVLAGHQPIGDDQAPGSWGGHCLSASSYDRTGPIFVTWGRRQKADWSWFVAYVDECYAIISSEWLDSIGTAPSGLDVMKLQDALQRIAA